MTPRWRSLLYVPVVAERFVAKAHERGADAIILELEDAVAPSEKERARSLVRRQRPRSRRAAPTCSCGSTGPGAWPSATSRRRGPDVRGLVLPKVDSAEHVLALAEVAAVEEERGLPVGHTVFFPRIEGPKGLLNAAEISAAHSRVVAVGLGSSDYTIATGMETGGPGNVASFVVVAAVAAGIVPIGLTGAIADSATSMRSAVAEDSRALGLRGAPCMHPSQVPILNEVFARPTTSSSVPDGSSRSTNRRWPRGGSHHRQRRVRRRPVLRTGQAAPRQ